MKKSKTYVDKRSTKEKVLEVLTSIYDPEIPVNICELGLIYGIHIDKKKNVKIDMTFTSPACPMAQFLTMQIENDLRKISEVKEVSINIVFDPPWDMSMMTDAAKLTCGFL